ncbi:transporter substrate-binding domain-containing protein [Maribrevibacterium harenarium]|uniref:Transporter substrate-binding domain-containing protein n=1 Tax=Maribrevibacterium harenarium TaxID=2589817 RepID=A0A501X4C7_9GAMM|nr:transporter substrate-binding domain-containing protein [Maribrevibacterium harenarium]TPE55372.1 transporter substrate-binding domain-containing protein [Maribrevibacterium harenarium]
MPINVLRHLLLTLCILLTTTKGWSAPLSLPATEQAWLREHPVVSVAYDGYFPPYSFLNSDGQLEGLSVELMGRIETLLGIRFEVLPSYKWQALYDAGKQQEVDIVATMVDQPERRQWFHFTRPYIFKSLVMITRDQGTDIYTRADLPGHKVALVKGYHYVDEVLEQHPTIEPVYVDTIRDALEAVSVGQADAAITFLGAAHYYRNKFLIANLRYAALYQRDNANASLAVRQDLPILARILDKALAAIPAAELQQLREKWLPTSLLEELVDITLTAEERAWIDEHKTLRLGVDPEFAPFEYIEEGAYKGIASDYVKLLNQRLGLNMVVVPNVDWQTVMHRVRRGDVDVLAAVGKTQERQGYLNFSAPYLQFHRVIITRSDTPFIAGVNDLEGMQVAVQRNSSNHGYVTDHTNLKPVLYGQLQEALLALSGGEVDAFIGNVAATSYWIRKLNLTNLKIAAPVSTDVQNLHFAVRNDWPELIPILEKGLATITAKERAAIAQRWINIDYVPAPDRTWLWVVATVAILLVVGFGVWTLILNRRVATRTTQLAYSTNFDQLTALPNRFLTLDRLQQDLRLARRQQRSIAVLTIDIDDFKKVNDLYGQREGDNILQAFTQRLRQTTSEDTTIGRLAGNQFLIIQKDFTEETDAALKAERLINTIKREPFGSSAAVMLSASIGIAVYPNDSNDPEELLRHSEMACYAAKELGNGHYSFYTDSLNRGMARRLELERHIYKALENGEFEVYYQAKINTINGQIAGVEALLRWHSPVLGFVSPAEFIPVVERNGLIEDIGYFVLNESLETLSQWQHLVSDQFSMAINLSPVQFRNNELIGVIESLIHRFHLNSHTIEFEITEGVMLSNYAGVEKVLKELEALGVSLAMDDFGTGYSSLSYLRQYKFDILKIDREFITDLTTDESDRKLVAATIAMAHELGMKVVAEGVETTAQHQILLELGCDYSQGWLYSKAQPKHMVTIALEKQAAAPSSHQTDEN